MRIGRTTIEKLTITGAKMPNGLGTLDPIAVMVEDFGPGAGKITITCFGEAWSHYWSHMGTGYTLSDFFCKCDPPYLASKLKPGIKPEIDDDDPDALTALMRKEIIRGRREGDISKSTARDRWDRAESYDKNYDGHDLLYEIFGDEYWYCTPKKPNHEYEYLCQIIKTVQAAFQMQAELEELKC